MNRLDRTLHILTYTLLGLPAILFFWGWLRWYIALPASTALIAGLILAVKRTSFISDKEFKARLLPKGRWTFIVLSAFILLAWLLLSGISGTAYQNWDFHGRNAVMHDLIDFSWPVRYDMLSQGAPADGALVYYFAFFLPAALVGKVLGFPAASWALCIYIALCLAAILLLLVRHTKCNPLLITMLLALWSGLDIVGYLLFWGTPPSVTTHMEWWAGSGIFQYSSMTTQLFWVFNQSVPAWLATALMLNTEKRGNLGLILALAIPSAPFPAVGLLPFIIYRCVFKYGRTLKTWFLHLKEALSFQSVLAALPILIVFGSFFTINNSLGSRSGILFSMDYFRWEFMLNYGVFLLLEFGLYGLILWPENRRNKEFYIAIAMLCILPFFVVGISSDLMMRASIPALLILVSLTAIRLQSAFRKGKRWVATGLVCLLLVGAVTPFTEIARSVVYTSQGYTVADEWKTFSDYQAYLENAHAANFVCMEPEKSFFFKYLAK